MLTGKCWMTAGIAYRSPPKPGEMIPECLFWVWYLSTWNHFPIPRCCKLHDECYENIYCPFYTVYLQPYYWKCYRGQPLCALENFDTQHQLINGCAGRLCECDRWEFVVVSFGTFGRSFFFMVHDIFFMKLIFIITLPIINFYRNT